MSIDDLGRRAGHDVRRTAHRLEASLPSAAAVAERELRLRARRRAAAVMVLVLPLVGSIALAAANSGGDGRTSKTTDGSANVGASNEGSSTLPDESTTTAAAEACEAGAAPAAIGAVDPAGCATSTSVEVIVDEPPTPTTVTIPPDSGPPATTTTTTSDTVGDGLGRVSGHVLAGPTCPVQSVDDPCDDAGIVATITFTMVRDDAELLYERTVTSASDGRYSIELAPGDFSVRVTSDSAMSCDSATVRVVDGQVVVLDLSCDTGIR